MVDINVILLIGGVVLVFRGVSWVFWGLVTRFSFYRETEVEDKFIYVEIYEFIGGWNTVKIKQHPKKLSKIFDNIRRIEF